MGRAEQSRATVDQWWGELRAGSGGGQASSVAQSLATPRSQHSTPVLSTTLSSVMGETDVLMPEKVSLDETVIRGRKCDRGVCLFQVVESLLGEPGDLIQTGSPCILCTPLPSHWRSNKSLPSAFKVFTFQVKLVGEEGGGHWWLVLSGSSGRDDCDSQVRQR